jgi:LacI family transcriptional regulator, galactose operon repressor
MATLKDVAKAAGVSVATVSYVLNGTGSVGAKTRNRVLTTVHKLGYRPNRAAQSMRTGQTKSLGLVLPDLTNPFFPELAQKIGEVAHKKGFAVILIDCQNEIEREEEGIAVLMQHNVDGVLWCPVSDNLPNNLPDLSAPTVIIDRPMDGFDVVQSNHIKSGNLLAEYIIGLGHHKIGFMLGPHSISGQSHRRQGFLDKAGKKLEVLWEIALPFPMKLTQEAMDILKKPSVSLIVAGSDVIAIGVVSFLNKNKKRVPNEISVIGYDDIPWAQIMTPQLTTIKQPLEEIAYESVGLLINKINNPKMQIRQILLDVSITERDSTRKFS